MTPLELAQELANWTEDTGTNITHEAVTIIRKLYQEKTDLEELLDRTLMAWSRDVETRK